MIDRQTQRNVYTERETDTETDRILDLSAEKAWKQEKAVAINKHSTRSWFPKGKSEVFGKTIISRAGTETMQDWTSLCQKDKTYPKDTGSTLTGASLDKLRTT